MRLNQPLFGYYKDKVKGSPYEKFVWKFCTRAGVAVAFIFVGTQFLMKYSGGGKNIKEGYWANPDFYRRMRDEAFQPRSPAVMAVNFPTREMYDEKLEKQMDVEFHDV